MTGRMRNFPEGAWGRFGLLWGALPLYAFVAAATVLGAVAAVSPVVAFALTLYVMLFGGVGLVGWVLVAPVLMVGGRAFGWPQRALIGFAANGAGTLGLAVVFLLANQSYTEVTTVAVAIACVSGSAVVGAVAAGAAGRRRDMQFATFDERLRPAWPKG